MSKVNKTDLEPNYKPNTQKYQLTLGTLVLDDFELSLFRNIDFDIVFDEDNSLSEIKSSIKEQIELITELFKMKEYYEKALGLI